MKDYIDSPMMWVLVVDDDETIRKTLRFRLEHEGYHVLEAPNGVAALKRLRDRTRRYVVLLDLMMPQMDGAGVLSEVLADAGLAARHAYILVTATHMLPVEVHRIIASLAIPVVSKPFNIDTLLDTAADAGRRVWAA